MLRETIIISNLDIKIMFFLKKEHNINEILDEFNMSNSQCRRHIKRINNFLEKREFGTFKFLKLNNKGIELLEILK